MIAATKDENVIRAKPPPISPRDAALRALARAQAAGLASEVDLRLDHGEAIVPSVSRPDLLHRVELVYRKRRPYVGWCDCEARTPCIHQLSTFLALHGGEAGWDLCLVNDVDPEALIDTALRRIVVPAVRLEAA